MTIIKSFTYRDQAGEEWSNKYYFQGAPPVSDVEWKSRFDALIAEEKKCYAATSSVVRVYGYNDDATTANAVFVHDYALAGTAVPGVLAPGGADHPYAGDQAGMLWAQTSRKTSRGKWIYLRKYMHDGFVGVDRDKPSTPTETAYTNFAQVLTTGTWDPGRIWRSRTQNEVLQLHGADPWVTTRTLKRRGKRPLARA